MGSVRMGGDDFKKLADGARWKRLRFAARLLDASSSFESRGCTLRWLGAGALRARSARRSLRAAGAPGERLVRYRLARDRRSRSQPGRAQDPAPQSSDLAEGARPLQARARG